MADHHKDDESRRSIIIQSQPQTNITTMKDDAPCTEWTSDHHYDNERRHSMYRVNPKPPLRQWKTTQHVQSQPPKHNHDNEIWHSMYRGNPIPPLRQWKTTQQVQSQSQTTFATLKDDTACRALTADHHYDNERWHTMYRVDPRPPLRQWKMTQHVHSQPQTIITTMKDDAACTESTPKHDYDNERRRSMYRLNPIIPLRQWNMTTQHVQSPPQNTITTMKGDTACTEATPDPHCDIERRHTMYRVDPRPPLRQWKTTQHVQGQSQTTITMMKDDASCTESIPDQYYDNERRHSMYIVNPKYHYDNERRRTMYRVNLRPPLRQWKTTHHVQSQPQTNITIVKDDAACT